MKHDMWKSSNEAPRIVQPIPPNMNFAITAKFDSVPSETYQLQGLVLQENADKFIRFGCYGVGGAQKLFLALIDYNSATVFYHALSPFAEKLRLERSGNVYTASVAQAGMTTFDVVDSFSLSSSQLDVQDVGLYAGNAGSNPPSYLASVDWFAFDSDPINDQDDPITVVPDLRDTIEVWTGVNMAYGSNGLGQSFVNVIGRAPVASTSLSYTLSAEGTSCPFTSTGQTCDLGLGSDGKRLVGDKDFNLEIYVNDLIACTTAGSTKTFYVDLDVDGAHPQTTRVTIEFTHETSLPALPMTVDWTSSNVLDYGQVRPVHIEGTPGCSESAHSREPSLSFYSGRGRRMGD